MTTDAGAIQLAAALRRCGLFRSVTDACLAALVAGAGYRVVGPESVIVQEGDPAEAMFVIVEGAVRVYATRPDGREIVLARLEAGEHFGEQALLPGGTGRRNASVRAVGLVRLAQIERAAFQALLEMDDALRERLIELGSEQVRARLQQLSPLAAGIGLNNITTLRRALAAGEVLFRQGDDADALYFVSAGRLGIWQRDGDRPVFIRYVDTGSCVGELALVRKERRSATVVAEGPAEVLEVSRAAFEEVHRTSPAVRQHLSTLEAAYELPRRGIVTQHAGTFMGHDAITSLYHLSDGRVFAASRVVGSDLYALEQLSAAGAAETLAWREHEARWRELRLTSEGTVVGLTARGGWPDAHAMHLFVLDGGRMGAAERERFLRSGTIELIVPPQTEDVVCHCVHVTVTAVRAAIAQGAASVGHLQKTTSCGTVCGGCMPVLAEMLGAEDWVVADVVTEREETPDIRSFELRPRQASYEAAHPGQHVIVEGMANGLRMRRPYTISSVSEPGGPLRITVKRESRGGFSAWLFDERPKEQPLRISRPRGDYRIDVSGVPVVCLVAGIGVTPALAAAPFAARTVRQSPFVVHYSGRSRNRMACLAELEALAGGSVQLVVRETSREGRLDQAGIAALVEHVPNAEWYLCGPQTYVDVIGAMLRGAGIAHDRIHVERFTPVGATPVDTLETRAALGRYILVPPVPHRPRPVVRALRRAGAALTALVNHRDRRGWLMLLNPLRWVEGPLGHAAGLDPAVPHELLAVVSGVCNGPFGFQLRAFQRLAGSVARDGQRGGSSKGERPSPDTADGETFGYWIPAVPFPRFPSPAVNSGWTRPGTGTLVPVYITRSRMALERLLRSGVDVDRSPIPYHFVQQVTGRIDVKSCPVRKAAGLIAGSFRHNATWSEDRALTTETFAFSAVEQFGEGIATTLEETCVAVDMALGREPERIVDLDVLLCRIAHTIIVRAVFGDVRAAELDALGRTLAEPIARLLGHVRHFAMGHRTIPPDYASSQRAARATWRAMVDLVRDLDRQGKLAEAARSRPTVRLLLETASEPDGGYDRLYGLFLPLIVAGHETTGHTLAWAFYEMARDPRMESAIVRETQQFGAAPGRGPLSTPDYDERPLAWALVAETLRRHPPVQSVARIALGAGVVPPDPRTGIGSFRFPSGAVFGISIVGVHLDPQRWPDPLAFRLERWLDGVRDGMSAAEQGSAVRRTMRAREEAFDWVSFAAGESRCPGHQFYVHEFFLVLDALLPRYRFELCNPDREVGDSEAMVVGPGPGQIAVRIRRR